MRLTLDNNCLIDLEEDRPAAPAVVKLIELHQAGRVEIFVGAISGAENLPGRVAPQDHSHFQERLDRLGISALPRVYPAARLGVSFVLGECVLGGGDNDTLEEDIKHITHPSTEPGFAEHLKARGLPSDSPVTPKWRNLFCDVDGLAAHIRAGHDIFVTSDDHFLTLSRRSALIALGAGDILTPEDALARVAALSA